MFMSPEIKLMMNLTNMEQVDVILRRVEHNKTLISNLQKNSNLTNYKVFNSVMFKLAERITKLEKLAEEIVQPLDQVFTKKDIQKNNLLTNFKHVVGILNLVEGKRSKKIKKIYQSDKKLQKISDKQLISVSKDAVTIANKLGGFSVAGFDKITTKTLQIKFERARKLSEDLGLTQDKVKKLEEATLNFARTMVEVNVIIKEKSKVMNQMTKLLDANDKLLEQRMDKFVEVYEKPGSNFSKTYKSLRVPEDSGKKEKKEKTEKEELA